MNCLMTVCPKIWFTKTDELPGVASIAACHDLAGKVCCFARQAAPRNLAQKRWETAYIWRRP